LMDLAKTSFFTDLRGDKISWNNPGVVIVNINVSFYAQAFMGERLGVLTGIASVSEKSFVVEQRVVNLDTGVVNCVAQTVMATYSKETMKSIPIDDDWRGALTACLGKNI
ncbi:MAG: acyl-CoA thioesterase, partial [Muribaculaceae bacterium]|nr:acyl-CoA thioesterase [Muribaculaceae bacterium]